MIEISPTLPQAQFISSKAPYPAMVAGFGAGKTEALILRALSGKFRNPKTNRAFYEPTYDLIRQIAWPRFEEILTTMQVPYRLLKSPHNTIEIDGCGSIIFRSMEIPQRIIGFEVADSDVDELDTLKAADAAECWRRILSRNRQKKHGNEANTVAVATTPEGFRFVYDTWVRNPRAGYQIIKAPTASNPHLPPGYIESLRAIYPDHLLQAYLLGEFVNLTSGTIYTAFNRKSHCTDAVETEHEHIFIGMDFNVGNMSAVIHVKREGKPIAVAEITKAYDTPHICTLIKSRWAGHPVSIFPDSSGGSRKSNDAGTTDLHILRSAGFSVYAPSTNPPVRDRINAVNAAFEKGGYLVNADRCPETVRCLEQQVYSANGDPDKTQGLDHLNDALGYFIHSEYPLVKPAMGGINIGMGY
jgi:hypothetical protein